MKRVRQINGVELYDLIRQRENVALAVRRACKGHPHDPQVQRIREDPEPYIDAVCEILDNGSFHYSGFRERSIWERGKHRDLCYTRCFPDRIIQHAVMQVVAPILLSTCTADTWAAQEGKGIHHAEVHQRRMLKADPDGTRYCLKCDIKGYFDHIRRSILWDQIKRKIRCPRTLEILHRLIFDQPGEDGALIGMYISQIFAVFYLHPVLHWLKERLRLSHVMVYMDDIQVWSSSKLVLRNVRRMLSDKLRSLGLTLKRTWQIFPMAARGSDFLGFVTFYDHAEIRKRIKISYKRAVRVVTAKVKHHIPVTGHDLRSVQSYEGLLGWCDTKKLMEIYSGRMELALAFGSDMVVS